VLFFDRVDLLDDVPQNISLAWWSGHGSSVDPSVAGFKTLNEIANLVFTNNWVSVSDIPHLVVKHIIDVFNLPIFHASSILWVSAEQHRNDRILD